MRYFVTFNFFYTNFSFEVERNFFSQKNSEKWSTYIYKNNHKMKIFYVLTYFLIFYNIMKGIYMDESEIIAKIKRNSTP